jgi:endonuclease-3
MWGGFSRDSKYVQKLGERAEAIRKILNPIYPRSSLSSFYRNPFELLVATILSAQCTDQQVNRVTPVLFKRMRNPQDFVRTPVAKSKGLSGRQGFTGTRPETSRLLQALIEHHDGRVPGTLGGAGPTPGSGVRPPTWCSAPPSARRALSSTPTSAG